MKFIYFNLLISYKGASITFVNCVSSTTEKIAFLSYF